MRFSDSLERATRRRSEPVEAHWTDEQFREQLERDLELRTVSSRQTVRAVLVALLIGLLLSTGKVVEIVERRELGPSRDLLLGGAEAIDRVANFLSLNRPADAIAELRGQRDAAGRNSDRIVAPQPPNTPGTSIPADADRPSISVPPSTTAPATVRRTPTVDDPLRILVAGDSQAQLFGDSLVNRAADGGRLAHVTVDSRVATGLARPDIFNWPDHLASAAAAEDYETVVVMLGANDLQDMEALDGTRLLEGTDEWLVEYGRRVEVTLDLLTAPERHVVWVLQLPLRGEDNALIRSMNEAARRALAGHADRVELIDGFTMFSDDEGNYASELVTDTGELKRVREGDGIHLARSGAAWLSRVVYAVIAGHWELPALE